MREHVFIRHFAYWYNRLELLPLLSRQSLEFVFKSDCVGIELVGGMLKFGNVVFNLVNLFEVHLETFDYKFENE